jgi:hypothetical protein
MEALLIPTTDLEVLRSFRSDGNITLSAYLQLDTPQRRESAYETFERQISDRLEECKPRPECREAIKEDVEIVELYLKTNGHRKVKGLAIFSCAAELFWRAYTLTSTIATQVSVGPRFDIEPLVQQRSSKSG